MTKEEESAEERVELTISILIRKNNSLSLSLSNYYTISSKNNPLSRVTTPISIMKMLIDSHRRSSLVTPSALQGRGTRRKWIAKKKLQRTDNF